MNGALFCEPRFGLPTRTPPSIHLVDADHATEQAHDFALGQCLQPFVLDPPSRAAADTGVAFEGQHGELVPIPGDQIVFRKPSYNRYP
jgi:hypothetical protein